MADKGKDNLKTSQMASMLGLTAAGVRYLEKELGIDPERSGEGGYRAYRNDDQAPLIMYQLYRMAGLSLPEAREALCAKPERTVALLGEAIEEKKRELAAMVEKSRQVERLIEKAFVAPLVDSSPRPALTLVHRKGWAREQEGQVSWNDIMQHMPTVFFGIDYGVRKIENSTLIVSEEDETSNRCTFLDGEDAQGIELPKNARKKRLEAVDNCLRVVVACRQAHSDECYLRAAVDLVPDDVTIEGVVIARFRYFQIIEGTAWYTLEFWLPQKSR